MPLREAVIRIEPHLRAGLGEWVRIKSFYFFIYFLVLHKTQHQLNSSLSFSLPSFLIFAGSHIQGPVCFPETGEWEGLTSSTPVWEGRAQRLTEQLCVPLHTHNSGHMTTRRWTRGREEEVVEGEMREFMAYYPLVRGVGVSVCCVHAWMPRYAPVHYSLKNYRTCWRDPKVVLAHPWPVHQVSWKLIQWFLGNPADNQSSNNSGENITSSVGVIKFNSTTITLFCWGHGGRTNTWTWSWCWRCTSLTSTVHWDASSLLSLHVASWNCVCRVIHSLSRSVIALPCLNRWHVLISNSPPDTLAHRIQFSCAGIVARHLLGSWRYGKTYET